MAWRCRFLIARPSQDGRVIAEKRLSEKLSGAPDALVDFHTGALYPEVAFFVDQTLTDGTSANVEYANRVESIEVVVRILSNEAAVEKLSREDVTFLKHELFGPVLGSTAGVAASA